MKLHVLAFMSCVLSICPSTLQAQTEIVAGWEEQVFPSYLLSTSTAKREPIQVQENFLGDPWGLFGVIVTAPNDNTPIKVSVHCEEFFEQSDFSGSLAIGGQQYSIFPKIRYRFDNLSKCRQATPATVTFRVTKGTESIEEITSVVTFRSINDCPFLWVEGEDVACMGLNFAAYVNEQHPFVDKLLREALDIGIVDRFVGYQEGTVESVWRQVYSLWDLMYSRDVRYSSITATSASSNLARSQHVRLIEETVNNTQANCVDGSVLFASLLRKIGIHSALILVPGHCYVGFWLDEQKQRMVAMETTLVDSMESRCKTPKELARSVHPDLRGSVSWPSFVDGIVVGSKNLNEQLEKNSPNPLEFSLIDIQEARRGGILPIPFSGSEEFLAFDHLADQDYDEDSDSQLVSTDSQSDDSDNSDDSSHESDWESEEDDSESDWNDEESEDSDWDSDDSDWDSDDSDWDS